MRNQSIISLLATLLTLCASSSALSDTLGFRLDAYSWSQEYEGTVQSGPDIFDINSDLGLDDDSQNSFGLALEHPIPLLPNIALRRTEMETEATGTVSGIFNGVTYSGQVHTESDLTHTDLTLYYEILDNWASIDLGITIRKFDEGVRLQGLTGISAGLSSEEIIDETIPLIYLAAKFELPLTGLYVGGQVNAIQYDDDEIVDYSVQLGYESEWGLGAEIGFRSLEIDYEDTSTETADLTIDGMYAGLVYHF